MNVRFSSLARIPGIGKVGRVVSNKYPYSDLFFTRAVTTKLEQIVIHPTLFNVGENMEAALAFFALVIAWWQLSLQRKELKRNGKITALVNMSTMIRDQISFYSKIINDLQAQKKPWSGHAATINQELRPLLAQINKEIIELAKGYDFSFSDVELKKALRLHDEQQAVAPETATSMI